VTPVSPETDNPADIKGAIELVLCAISGNAKSLLLSLEGLAGSDYNPQQLLELLEQMSLIEVTRDLNGNPDLWAMVDTQVLVNNGSRSSFLCYWDDSAKESLQQFDQVSVDFDDAFCKFNSSVEPQELQDHLSDLEIPATSVSELLQLLPDFSYVRKNLETKPLVGFEKIELFDVISGHWRQSEHLVPGAVRLTTQFGRRHYYVTDASLAQVSGIPCSATVAKYLMANELGKSLLANGTAGQVYVPRGCLVPGIYGRVLLLASGEVPKESIANISGQQRIVLEYRNVDIEVARKLASMLSA